MSAPHRSSRRSTDHASTATERAANAARAMAVRAARRRDRMVEMGIALLDEFLPSGQRPQTRAEVGEFYTVADTVVAQVLRCHAAEFRRDTGTRLAPSTWPAVLGTRFVEEANAKIRRSRKQVDQ